MRTTMRTKAWRIHEYGGSDVLRLEEVDLPALRPDEVRVRVKAAGINRSDLLWIGAGFFKPELPSLVGAEICGVIEEIGSGVTGFAPGDRISNLPIFTRGAARAYSHFAECVNLPAEELARTPDTLSDAQGAAFMFTNLTQICGLTEIAKLKPGETLLVTAGSSANGMSAILLGRKLGARVIATTRSAAKRDLLLQTGAHEVVATDEESLSARVLAMTGGRGADVVYDCVGGALTNEIVDAAAPEARWVMYGFLDTSPATINWPRWFASHCSLHIFSLTQFTGSSESGFPGRPVEFQRAVHAVNALCEEGLEIPIAQTLDGITSVQDAFRAMERNRGGGKIVVCF